MEALEKSGWKFIEKMFVSSVMKMWLKYITDPLFWSIWEAKGPIANGNLMKFCSWFSRYQQVKICIKRLLFILCFNEGTCNSSSWFFKKLSVGYNDYHAWKMLQIPHETFFQLLKSILESSSKNPIICDLSKFQNQEIQFIDFPLDQFWNVSSAFFSTIWHPTFCR